MGGTPIPPQWVLDQTIYHRFLLWLVWKASGSTVKFSIREAAYALHVSKTAAERALAEAVANGMLAVAPVPVSREGATYSLIGLLEFVSQEVSQLNGKHKNLGQTLGQKSDNQPSDVSAATNRIGVVQELLPLSGMGQQVGQTASVPASVPIQNQGHVKRRRLPMSKRDREREQMLGRYHADTGRVMEAMAEMWPTERSNKTKIGCPFADTVARIDERLQEGIPADDLIAAARLYLEENAGFESEIRFFLGPGKPGAGLPKWAKYVRAIRFTEPAQAEAL